MPTVVASRGVTFIEICVAVAILAMAVLPVFALVTGGLVRSDMNVAWTTAGQILQGLMSNLQADSFPFTSIPVSPAGTYRQPAGSVAADPRLDPVFGQDSYTVDAQLRYVIKAGLRYDVELWAANCDQDADLVFRHLETPVVNYYSDPTMQTRRVLLGSDYATYSPYCPSLPAASLVTGSSWASRVVSGPQSTFTEPTDDGSGTLVYNNLKKLVLRVSWSTGASYARGQGQRTLRELWLVSFRANLSE